MAFFLSFYYKYILNKYYYDTRKYRFPYEYILKYLEHVSKSGRTLSSYLEHSFPK